MLLRITAEMSKMQQMSLLCRRVGGDMGEVARLRAEWVGRQPRRGFFVLINRGKATARCRAIGTSADGRASLRSGQWLRGGPWWGSLC